MVVNLMMQNYLYGRVPLAVDLRALRVHPVRLPLPAVVSVMLNPRKPTFKVTAKDETLDKSHISELAGRSSSSSPCSLIAVGVTVWQIISQPYQADVTLVVGVWNVLNLIIAGCALGVVSERQSDRQSQRINVERWCKLKVGGEGIPAVIENVSVRGLGIRPMAPSHNLKPGDTTEITIVTTSDEKTLTLPITIQKTGRDEKGLSLGVRMDTSAPDYSQAIADLFFADAEQWNAFQQARRSNIGVLLGTARFLVIALYQTGRGLSYLFGLQRLASRPNPEGVSVASEGAA